MMITIRKVLKKGTSSFLTTKRRKDGVSSKSSVSSTVVDGETEGSVSPAAYPSEVKTKPKKSKAKRATSSSSSSHSKAEKAATPPKPKEETLILTDSEIQTNVTQLAKQYLMEDVSARSAASEATEVIHSYIGNLTEAELEERQTVIRDWIQIVNQHDLPRAKQYVTDDVTFQFAIPNTTQVEHEFTWEEWSAAHFHLNASFPDFTFRYENVDTQYGVIILKGFRASGTHTGEPFGFGPYEPIPATGKAVENDPEQAYFYFRHDNHKQFCRVTWYTTGEMTGPDGIYTQLGGFPTL